MSATLPEKILRISLFKSIFYSLSYFVFFSIGTLALIDRMSPPLFIMRLIILIYLGVFILYLIATRIPLITYAHLSASGIRVTNVFGMSRLHAWCEITGFECITYPLFVGVPATGTTIQLVGVTRLRVIPDMSIDIGRLESIMGMGPQEMLDLLNKYKETYSK
jgi:hypothetical protein